MPLPRVAGNSLFSNSFFIFIIRFFPSLANLLVVIWYSKHLPVAMYGNYQHFWIQLFVIYPLACFGIHVLIVTYSRDMIMKLIESISGKYYLLYGLWVAGLSLAFALLQSGTLNIPFLVPFLFLAAYSLSVILESFLIVFRNYTLLSIISILYSAAYAFVHWYVLKQGFSLQMLFSYLLGVTACRLCLYCGIAFRNMMKHHSEGVEEGPAISTIRNLWLHLGVYDVLQILFSWIDKFIISLLLTAQLSAIYVNGSMNIPIIPLLLSAAGSAVLMQLAAGKQEDDTADVIRLMNQAGKILSAIVFPFFFFLLFFRQELIITLLSDKYILAIPVFMMSVLVLPLRAYSFTTVLQKMHKGAIINIGAVADLLLACGLMYPLYKWLGLPGVALSFVISTYLQATFYLVYSAKLLNVSPLKLIPYANWLTKLIVFATLLISIHYACNLYFTDKITLILGAAAMTTIIMVSLLVELKKQKHVGI